MRVLVVENDKVTLLGQIGVALEEAGAEIDICRPHAGDTIPADDTAHDAIVVMGGPQNALDDEGHAYLPALAALMRRFGDADKSVLGVCLGSQLLARAYGGDNLIGTRINEAVATFRSSPEFAASVMLKQVPNPSSFGVAEVDEAGNVVRLVEKPKEPRSDLALVGIYLFRASIFEAISMMVV